MSTSNSPEPLTRRQRVEERERNILEAANVVFVEFGYEGARMAEIARRAGIAEGTIYLYYKTKNDLMRAVVSNFWDNLTADAEASLDRNSDTMVQLEALASFHVNSLIDKYDFIELTMRVNSAQLDMPSMRDQMRQYVTVFDTVFQQGVDRGVFQMTQPLWVIRDVFFGTLDYSARTIVLHDDRGKAALVIDNLITLFKQTYGVSAHQAADTSSDMPSLIDRLERAVGQMEEKLT